MPELDNHFETAAVRKALNLLSEKDLYGRANDLARAWGRVRTHQLTNVLHIAHAAETSLQVTTALDHQRKKGGKDYDSEYARLESEWKNIREGDTDRLRKAALEYLRRTVADAKELLHFTDDHLAIMLLREFIKHFRAEHDRQSRKENHA